MAFGKDGLHLLHRCRHCACCLRECALLVEQLDRSDDNPTSDRNEAEDGVGGICGVGEEMEKVRQGRTLFARKGEGALAAIRTKLHGILGEHMKLQRRIEILQLNEFRIVALYLLI